MNHFPILQNTADDVFLEFSHFNYDAPAGLWSKKNVIILNGIKINVFVEGSFSVFSDGVLHVPMLGDISFFSPMKMHYGQIKEPMHINYYQIDIGLRTFSSIPNGEEMIHRLLECLSNTDPFLRPDTKNRDRILSLCREIEMAIVQETLFLAYAKVIELLTALYSMYLTPSKVTGEAFSRRTAQTVRYIEKNYADHVSVRQIADDLGVSTSFLSRIFKKEIGVTIHEYLNQYRISKAIPLLETHSVTEVGYLCGFCDNSHFISIFKRYVGTTPMQYKRRQY